MNRLTAYLACAMASFSVAHAADYMSAPQRAAPLAGPTDRPWEESGAQLDFCKAVAWAHLQSRGATNEIALAALYDRRAENLDRLPTGQIKSWLGAIVDIGVLQDGTARVLIRLSEGCFLENYSTSIPSDSAMYSVLSKLPAGSAVIISGSAQPHTRAPAEWVEAGIVDFAFKQLRRPKMASWCHTFEIEGKESQSCMTGPVAEPNGADNPPVGSRG
jgi:hypothetical protein